MWPGCGSSLGEARGGGAVAVGEAGELPLELRQTLLGVVEGLQFLFGDRELGRQLEHRLPMLAGQRLERGGMAFDLFLARRVHVQVVEIAAQHLGRFVYQDGRLRQLRGGPGEFGVGLRRRAQGDLGLRQ